jgi:predicted acylesterase/phospholipase RssA
MAHLTVEVRTVNGSKSPSCSPTAAPDFLVAFAHVRIEGLPPALRFTTTDAATGERVMLRSGSLVQALRASIALPFMFRPVHIDGRRLIVGFVADPLPVSVAADAHAALALGLKSPCPTSWRRTAAPPKRRCRPSARCCTTPRNWRWRERPLRAAASARFRPNRTVVDATHPRGASE